ncbi:hypothetical protein SAMN06265795_10944 [Noviherbaspirillum humi]|uniref:Uncharacterized protein n=1 Tax=Noviherbaspirillum humi TaxID=1688639 RepID=A0A239ICB2_9BURK|nr:hypothetical protein [Noviherbaspirillum humi]SNS91185.1 hypothetical protein SAMN06265795_10944 [Noviherbaspirillum humi]
MKRLSALLMLLPVLAFAQGKPAGKSSEPAVLVRETCDPPTEPVAKNVFAITCGSDEVLIMLTLKQNGATRVVWERHPYAELKRLTSGIHYQVIREAGKK